MNIKINEISKTKKEIEVDLSLEEIEKHQDKAAEIISSEKRIDGFRPGKAPKKIIEEKFGKEIIWQESANLAVKESYFQIMKEKDFLIISSPEIKIESIELDKPLTYKIIIEILPEITLPDYKKIAKEETKNEKEIVVEEKEVEKALEDIQKSRAKIKLVNRTAQKGDEVSIDFQGLIDGIEQEQLNSKNLRIIIGEGRMIKGFEEELIDLKENDSKTFFLKMDINKDNQKDVEFRVKVNSVSERELPELNDEFAKSLGEFSDLKNLREKIKENIKSEKEQREKERVNSKIINAITDKTSAEIPESMIDKEVDGMIEEFKARLTHSKVSFEEYLKNMKKNEQSLKEESRISAKKRILRDLIFQEIAKREKIEIPESEIEKEANNYLNNYHDQGADLPDMTGIKAYIKNIMVNEKIFEILKG